MWPQIVPTVVELIEGTWIQVLSCTNRSTVRGHRHTGGERQYSKSSVYCTAAYKFTKSIAHERATVTPSTMKDGYRYCYRVVRGVSYQRVQSSVRVVGASLCLLSADALCVVSLSRHSSCGVRDHLSSSSKRSPSHTHTLRHGALYGARRRHARRIRAERHGRTAMETVMHLNQGRP